MNLASARKKASNKLYTYFQLDESNAQIKKRLIVTVEDSGIGINEQDQQNLFKLFGKLKDSKNLNP